MKCKKCDNELKFQEIKCSKCGETSNIKVCILIFGIVFLFGFLGLMQDSKSYKDIGSSICGGLIMSICFFIYWTPTIIAVLKKHENKIPIIILNCLMGWTVVCWIIALIWALKNNVINEIKTVQTIKKVEEINVINDKNKENDKIKINKYDELEKLGKLKENGILTEEEFNKEKEKILK